MAFLQNLRDRGVFSPPSSNSGDFANSNSGSAASTVSSMMPFVHQLRELNFDDDMRRQQAGLNGGMPSQQQGRMRQAFNPNQQQGDMDVVFNAPPAITPYQQASLGVEKQRLAQQGAVGEERSNLGKERLAFDKQKSDQIYETKNAEAEQRAKAAEERLAFSQRQLESQQGNQKAIQEFNQAKQDALLARQELEAARRNTTDLETQRATREKERQALLPETTETTNFGEPDESGAFPGRRVTTTKGPGSSQMETPQVPMNEREGLPVRNPRMRDIRLNEPMPSSHEEFMASQGRGPIPQTAVNQPVQQPVQSTPNQLPPPPPGRIRVVDPNGKTGTITQEELASLPAGWKRM